MATYNNDASLLTLADGTSITPANTGPGGRAADAVPLGGAGVATVETDFGPRVYRFSGPNASDISRWDWTGANTGQMSLEALFRVAAYPTSADCRIMVIRTSSTDAASVNLRTDGTLRVFNAAGDSLYTTSTPVPLNAPFRVHLGAGTGTTTGNGQLRFAYYTANAGQSTTPAETPYSLSSANTGTTAYVAGRFGKISNTALATINVAYMRMSDSQYTAIGPLTLAGPEIAGSSEIVGRNLAGYVSGGTGPYSIVSATQISGTSVGTITVSGLLFYCAKPTDTATIRVIVEDSLGVDSEAFDVTITPTGGGGSSRWIRNAANTAWE